MRERPSGPDRCLASGVQDVRTQGGIHVKDHRCWIECLLHHGIFANLRAGFDRTCTGSWIDTSWTCPGSSGRRNTLREEVAMTVRKRRSDRSGRGALPSLGRPSVARREDHRQFWAAIAAGCSSEDAAVGAGVSPAVGARWFRRAGGMPPSHLSPSSKSLSRRYLTYAERE